MDWSLTSIFPEFRGPEMLAFSEDLQKRITASRESNATLAPLGSDNGDSWEKAILALEDIVSRQSHLGVYVGCLCAADATHEGYASERARLSKLGAEISILHSQILQGFQGATSEDVRALTEREKMADAGFAIARFWEHAKQRMSLPEEELAAELAVDGISAWSRMFDSIAGKLEFEFADPNGTTKRLPISQCRALMTHADRAVRKAAFEGGSAAWASVADPLRASLNAISGTRLTLNQRRGIPHFLDVALDDAHTSHGTLDALFAAIESSAQETQNLLQFKADRMGLPGITWYDLEASLPLPESDPVDWPTALKWVSAAFHRTYPKLGEFFDEIVEAKWIDWSQRPGKRPGGFCTTSSFNGESRIFMTHNDCAHDMMTLAHEVGHAWHSRVLKDRRPFAQDYPMTLAECASTFAELLLVEGVNADPNIDPIVKLQLASQELNHSSSFLLDIPVRFRFEKALYEKRGGGELGVSELNELMAQTQRDVFGKTLVEGGENPLFWAEKGHFYIAGVSFYNFPYTYGYLLSRALAGMFQSEGDAFFERFESFLLTSGSATCEDVARQTLDADLEDAEFWKKSIASFGGAIGRTEKLLAEVEGK